MTEWWYRVRTEFEEAFVAARHDEGATTAIVSRTRDADGEQWTVYRVVRGWEPLAM
jgi:hypothetical protein